MVTDYIEAEIFWLHENADITCDQNETYNMFSTILAMQPRVSGGSGVSREDTIVQLCESIASKVKPLCSWSWCLAICLKLCTHPR